MSENVFEFRKFECAPVIYAREKDDLYKHSCHPTVALELQVTMNLITLSAVVVCLVASVSATYMQQYQQYQPQYIPVAVQSGGYGYGGGLGGFGGGLGGGGGGFGGGLMSLLFFSKYSYNLLHTQFKW